MNLYDFKDKIANLIRGRFPTQSYEMVTGLASWLCDVFENRKEIPRCTLNRAFVSMVENVVCVNSIVETLMFETTVCDFTRIIPNVRGLRISNAVLGRGAYGDVRSGTFNHRPVAVKQFINIEQRLLYSQASEWSVCLTEIAMLSKLQGSGVVGELYGVGWFQSRWTMVIEPHSIRSHKWRTHMMNTDELTKKLMNELYAALRTVHAVTGYIHGDIKPENVMIDIVEEIPKIRLIDFGLAEPVGTIHKHHQYVQTIYWRAPELLACVDCDLVMTDMWAATITAFDIMTGHNVMCDFGANINTTDAEMLCILEQHCLNRTTAPEQWMEHVPAELHEFANEIYVKYCSIGGTYGSPLPPPLLGDERSLKGGVAGEGRSPT